MMKYDMNIDGFAGQDLNVEYYFWSKPKLYINDKLANSSRPGKGMILERNDGKHVSALD